jgi:hypothetical protein
MQSYVIGVNRIIRSVISCALRQNDQVEGDELVRVCRAHGGEEECI